MSGRRDTIVRPAEAVENARETILSVVACV